MAVARVLGMIVSKPEGCRLLVTATERRNRELDTAVDWFGSLTDVFGLDLADVGGTERAALWSRVRTAHDAWLATQTG